MKKIRHFYFNNKRASSLKELKEQRNDAYITIKLSDSGRNTFQPSRLSWS